MTQEELRNLRPGDIVRNQFSGEDYLVTANYGTRATAVRTADITHWCDWDLVRKVLPLPRVVREDEGEGR